MKDRFRQKRICPNYTLRLRKPFVQFNGENFISSMVEITNCCEAVGKSLASFARQFGKTIATIQMVDGFTRRVFFCREHSFAPPDNSGLAFCPYCEFPDLIPPASAPAGKPAPEAAP